MPATAQRTLNRSAAVSGVGFFTNADITCRLMPARPNAGITFVRVDLPGKPTIPATIDYAVERHRRTALQWRDASVELTEHLLAALAGLNIDNCRIEIDGPEPPGGDGSALHFVEAILAAGICEQNQPARTLTTSRWVRGSDTPELSLSAQPSPTYRIRYELDYGDASPVAAQSADFNITPENFVRQIAPARTFILEAEIAALKSLGYGQKVRVSDLLIFGANGPIENQLRFDNECARHKLLDCIGDFALAGCRLNGTFLAARTGHANNRQLIRQLCAESPIVQAA